MAESVQHSPESTATLREKPGRFRNALDKVRRGLTGQKAQKERTHFSKPLGLFAIALCTVLLNSAEYSAPVQPTVEPALAQAKVFEEYPDEPLPPTASLPTETNTQLGTFQKVLESATLTRKTDALGEALAAPHEFMDQVEHSQVDSAIILHFGANNELLGYQLINEKTGETSAPIPFFTRQKEAITQAQTKAKESNMPQIANFAVVDNTFFRPAVDLLDVAPNTPDSPWVTEKPADVLTDEELATHGISILNPSGDSPKLYLRESILTEGFLKPLLDLRELDPEYKVVIVPVDAPYMAWDALEPQQEEQLLQLANDFGPGMEASMRNYEATHVQHAYAIRTTYANQMKQNIQAYQEMIATAQSDAERHDAQFFVRMAAENNLLVQSLTDQELALSSYRDYSGLNQRRKSYTTGLHYNDSGAKQNFLFFAMGDANANMAKRVFIWAQPDGSLTTSYMYPFLDPDGLGSNIPTPDKNRRTILDYGIYPFASEADDNYRFNHQDSAQIVRHELAHAALITWVPKIHELMSEVPDYTYPWLAELATAAGIEYPDLPSRSEYLTDTITIGSINQAEQWLTEHGTDNGYPFVIEIPPSKHTPDTTYSISQKAQDKLDAVAAAAANATSNLTPT